MASGSFKRGFGWSQLGLEKACGNFNNAVGLWSLAAWFDGGRFGGGQMPFWGEGGGEQSELSGLDGISRWCQEIVWWWSGNGRSYCDLWP